MLALTVISCRISQLGEQLEKLGRLADKQPHVGQELPRARGGALGLGRANDRTDRELLKTVGGGEFGIGRGFGLLFRKRIPEANT
jgi:hypothetical protein